MKKRVIITGATGFVGKNLLRFLDTAHYDITLMSRDLTKLNENLFGFSVVYGDLNDKNSLKKAFEQQDILINLAAEVRNQEKLDQTNVQGTNNLIEAVKYSGISKIIHLSSVGVVGKSYSPVSYLVDELERPTPQNLYEQTKLKSEEALFNQNNGAYQLVVLRPTNVFGEMHPFNALNNLMTKIQHQKTLLGTKEAKVNYLYVGDLCQVITFFLTNDSSNGVFHVGDSMNLIEFYRLIAKKLGVKLHCYYLPNFLRDFLDIIKITKLRVVTNQIIYTDLKLKNEIGNYEFGVDKGLDLTIDYFRKNNLLK
ncbi:MAG: UDP-glucose 4-epimerase [Fluviicola sp.]|jgi:nucleoside-diphosphate-sugar epimerase|uniref:NAD-dependent epimerase/dehydratase family protein n=1 Tax=Fluviicola sp. TaxID=1917219 RepID=UPI00261FC191|nr:NAD(P)-dependent oxidoreductase [Fluviicola sp.]MDF3028638.1 UDP-glucose 4-epimerase [Fluviicola sp.]